MQKKNSRHSLEFTYYKFKFLSAFILSSKSGCDENNAQIPCLHLVDIFIAASFESSLEAIFCILLSASSQAIIFSFHKNLALPSSALNSLYLLNLFKIKEAIIQNNICNIIFITK